MNYSEPWFGFALSAAPVDWFVWRHKRVSVPTKRTVFGQIVDKVATSIVISLGARFELSSLFFTIYSFPSPA